MRGAFLALLFYLVGGEEAPHLTPEAALPAETVTTTGGEQEANSTKPHYYPAKTKDGLPVDEKIDQYFADAIWTMTRRPGTKPKFSRIPSWHWAMLNDAQRNSAYRLALNKAVAKVKSQGKVVRVLDIGSGTGLLAMLAGRAGADHVTTCEENENLVEVAVENIRRAQLRYPMCPVVVVGKLSTNLTVGPGQDMEKRANILVSEIVDSMLLRESIIPTLHHAMAELVEPDAVVIPSGGKLTFMAFESKELRDTRYLDSDVSGFDLSFINEGCHDLNSQEHLPDHNYRALSNPVVGMEFDFANVPRMDKYEFFALNLTMISDGVIDGVVMWLDLNLDHEITVSCDPRLGKAHHPHWQHVLFYPRFPLKTRAGDHLTLLVGHGETSVRAKLVFFSMANHTRSIVHIDPSKIPTMHKLIQALAHLLRRIRARFSLSICALCHSAAKATGRMTSALTLRTRVVYCRNWSSRNNNPVVRSRALSPLV